MDATTLRSVLAALRRQWWVLLQAVVVVGAGAAFMASRIPPNPYQATATFLVKPDSTDPTSGVTNMSTFLSTDKRLLTSEGVAAEVARRLGGGRTADQARGSIKVFSDASVSAIAIVAFGPDPETPVLTANTFANVFIETQANQRTTALRTRATQLDDQVKTLDDRITQLTKDLAAQTGAGADTTALLAAKEAAIRQYSTVADQQQQVLTALAIQPSLAELIEPAKVPFQAPTPSVPVRGALGAVMGLVFGVAVAVIRELLDDKLRSPEDASRLADANVLVELPKGPRKALEGVPVFDGTNGAMAEALRSLRTTVQFLGIERPIRAVAVTSPEMGDGKSTVAVNLAAAYAMAGSRTLLVSGDLRKPSLDALFGVAGELGFSDLLFDRARLRHGHASANDAPMAPLGDYLVPTTIPNLAVLPAGSPTRSPAELLASAGLADVVAELTAAADVVVIDSPPTIVTDSVMLARMVDGVLLVASLNRTHKSRMRAAVDVLQNARVNVLGTVLNRSTTRADAYGYYAPDAPRVTSSSIGTAADAVTRA